MADKDAVFARFEYADDLIKAILDLVDAGYDSEEIEVFSPIPLEVEHLNHSEEVDLDGEAGEKLEKVLFKKGNHVKLFTRLGAVVGISLAVLLVGVTPLTYPIEPPQQGGLPIVPFPPMAILAFETMILIAFIASISGFAILTRMQRSKSKVYDHLLTVDRFAIGLVDLNDESMTAAIEIFKQNHTEDIDEFFEAKPNKSQELREI